MKYTLLSFLKVFILFIIIFGCTKEPEKVFVKEIKTDLESTIYDACNIIQNNKLDISQKNQQLEKALERVDSLSNLWEANIDSIRANHSEKELENIENEFRMLNEKMAKTVLKEMPEFREIYR